MKKLIAILTFIAIANFVKAQNPCYIKYTYDASGNRIKREFICAPVDSVIEEGPGESDPDCCPSSKLANNNANNFDFNVYPNPAKDIFTLEILGLTNEANIIIYNNFGQQIKHLITSETIMQFNLMTFSNGVYYISVQTSAEKVTKKIIKQ
jgi:hypothetical protein